MSIYFHSAKEMVDGSFRLIGEDIAFDAPTSVVVRMNGRQLLCEKRFNPNYFQVKQPSRPKLNVFVIDISKAELEGGSLGEIEVFVHQGDACNSTLFSRQNSIVQRIEPLPSPTPYMISNPKSFDAVLEDAAHKNIYAVYFAVRNLINDGSIASIPHEMKIKWLDLAVFSLLCDGVNSVVDERLLVFEGAIREHASGSYALISVLASRALIEGNISKAISLYEKASICSFVDVSAWTSGMSGMTSSETISNILAVSQLIAPSFEIIGPLPARGTTTILASADSRYFNSYGKILAGSATRFLESVHLHYNVINPTPDDLELMGALADSSNGRVSFSSSRYDLSHLGDIDRIGFFTLNRFMVVPLLLDIADAPIFVVEADARLTENTEEAVLGLSDEDFGYLAMQRYVRPWLHTTAPLLYINSTAAGKFFARSLFASIAATLMRTKGRLLWGADQASIFCAAKYCELYYPEVRTVNVTSIVEKVIFQAQEHPAGKAGFANEQ